MRLLGSILLAFGVFCLFVTGVALVEPNLRANGIAIAAMTTSAVGTGIIGGLALIAGALLRRRGMEARRERQAAAAARQPRAVEAPPIDHVPTTRADRVREEEGR